jgi:hypothetical protein
MSTKEKKTEVETVNWVDSWVNMFWNGYEKGMSTFLKQLEEKEDAYLRAWESARKSAQEFRNQLEGTLKNVSKANWELLNEWNDNGKGIAAEYEGTNTPLQDAVTKLEKIAWTPWKFAVDWLERSEKQLEEGNKELVKFLRDHRESWAAWNEAYVVYSKKNQNAWLSTQLERVQSIVGLPTKSA